MPAWRVFVFLVALYLVTFGGGPHSVDEIAYLGVARSLALRGSFDTNELFWMVPVAGDPRDAQSAIGPTGDVWAKKGPAASLVMAPLIALARAAGRDLAFVGLTGMMFITAATGSALVAYARSIGIHRGGAVALGLTYGVATIAMPYARLGFAEPVAALAIVLAAWLVAIDTRVIRAFMAGIALGLAVWSKPSEALVALPFAGVVLLGLGSIRRSTLIALVGFGLGSGAMLAALAGYNLMRFGDPFVTGYALGGGESFGGDAVQGLLGLTISPYRGLLIYSPLAVLAVILTPIAWRRHRRATFLGLAVAMLHLLTFAFWWKWWGGAGWGPRFLLPAVPLLIPLIGLSWPRLNPIGRSVILVTMCSSLPVQFLGATQDFNVFEGALSRRHPGFPEGYGILAFDGFAPWDYARRLSSLGIAALDVAWVRDGEIAWRLLTPLLVAITAAAVALVVGRGAGRPRFIDVVALGATLVAFAALVSVGPRRWTPAESDLMALAAQRTTQALPGDGTIVIVTPESPALWSANLGSGTVYGLNPTDGLVADGASRLLDLAFARHDRLWILASGVDPAAATNATEREIARRGYLLRRDALRSARLDLYAVASPPPVAAEVIATYDGRINVSSSSVRKVSGGGIVVDVGFMISSLPPSTTKVFVHVYGNDGRILGQSDHSFLATEQSAVGYLGRYGIITQPYTGTARVDIGLYDGVSGRRLSGRDATGQALAENRLTIGVLSLP